MKCFLWAMNYVPLWNDFCGQRIRSHGICWLPVLAFIFSHLQFEVSAELFPLSGGARCLQWWLFPCFPVLGEWGFMPFSQCMQLLCCRAVPPHPGLASKAPGFLFVWSTHACFEMDAEFHPPLRYVVCVRPLFLMFSCGGWWDAAEVCWVSDTERDHSLLQAKSEAWSNVFTTWLGDHYVLVFVPALRFFWIHIQCWL